MHTEDFQRLADRLAVEETITTMFVATDARDWERVAQCFAAEVLLDMSSVGGAPPARFAPTQITAGWDAAFRPLDAVHHQIGNLQVRLRGDEADATCHGVAWHYRRGATGGNTRLFVGSYLFHLVRDRRGWLIDRFRFDLKFIDGNPQLEERARPTS
ncbi:MAG TPA: nuclear transport factor 2 family protein [Gemmatimonadales bacterium]|nr:nuclear transport factor 2 family protein [Gemmatimonadales bacterium]